MVMVINYKYVGMQSWCNTVSIQSYSGDVDGDGDGD